VDYKAQVLFLCPLGIALSKYQTIDYSEFGGCMQNKYDKKEEWKLNLRLASTRLDIMNGF
jgi:hypothetical protein